MMEPKAAVWKADMRSQDGTLGGGGHDLWSGRRLQGPQRRRGKDSFLLQCLPTPDMEQQVVTQNQHTPPHWPAPGGHPQKKKMVCGFTP